MMFHEKKERLATLLFAFRGANGTREFALLDQNRALTPKKTELNQAKL